MKLAILAIFFLLGASASHHNCIHDKVVNELKMLEEPTEDLFDGRNLAGVYDNMRITFDFSNLASLSSDVRNYLIENITIPAENYFETALKVNRLTTNITIANSLTCSSQVAVPKIYQTTGTASDLLLFVTAANEPSQNYVAYAGSCVLGPYNRPVVGRLHFNLAYVFNTANPVTLENNIMTAMHELTHVLAFSSSLYKYFINPDTNTLLTDHILKRTINGASTTVLDVDPLTTRLQNYFGCPSIEGAPMENQGGAGTLGQHFERKIFFNEYMTGNSIIDLRISEFTLALLEGSGWYQVNYAMADPMTWGKGKGCGFINSPCMDKATQTPNFEEFCPMMERRCSWTGRAGGVCGNSQILTDSTIPSVWDYWGNKTAVSDPYSDNCPTMTTYSNADCEDSTLGNSALLGSRETYAFGSKCFMGTLYPTGQLTSPFSYCFKQKCTLNKAGGFTLTVTIGTVDVACLSKGSVSVTGLKGQLYCPDPNKFCKQVTSEGFCKRGCSGRGSCIAQTCDCQDGWGGFDCSKKIYDLSCSRCANTKKSPLTACYGDTCACAPNDLSCIAVYGTPTTKIVFGDETDEILGSGSYGKVNDDSNKTGSKTLNPLFIGLMVVGVVAAVGVGAVIFYKRAKKMRQQKNGADTTTAGPKANAKLNIETKQQVPQAILGQEQAFSPLSLFAELAPATPATPTSPTSPASPDKLNA